MHEKNQINVFSTNLKKRDVMEAMEKPQVKFFLVIVALIV